MSRTNAITLTRARRRPLVGAALALLAWIALLIAPVAAQAMTRIDSGVPGAVICSVNKLQGGATNANGGKAAAPHCQLCTLAQKAVDTPIPAQPSPLRLTLIGALDVPPAQVVSAPDPFPGHPPRAPPLA